MPPTSAAVRQKILCRAKESGNVRADIRNRTMVQCLTRFICCFTVIASLSFASAENWPGWRGPRGDGTSLEKNVPLHWSATSNVVWKTELQGLGHASPIVWEDRVFTVTCVPETEERRLLCLDRPSGKMLWQQSVVKSPLEKKHRLNSHASS